jgi:hypothetical protein
MWKMKTKNQVLDDDDLEGGDDTVGPRLGDDSRRCGAASSSSCAKHCVRTVDVHTWNMIGSVQGRACSCFLHWLNYYKGYLIS